MSSAPTPPTSTTTPIDGRTDFSTQSVERFLEATAAKTPTPGGGAVTSVLGALAAALAGMVTAYSVGKKNLAEHDGWLREVEKRLARARSLMLALAGEDEAAYGQVNELMKLPAGDARREREMPGAVAAALAAPRAVQAAAVDLLRLFEELAGKSNRMLRSDLGIAAELALATARGSVWNIAINAGMLPEAQRPAVLAAAEAMAVQAEQLRGRVAEACRI